jgi:hypothetical protein
MRRPILTVAAATLLAGTNTAHAQAIDVRVDPRVELIAIVARLAGRSEYNLTRVPRWAEAVDTYFAPYRDHPAVAMTRRLGFGFFIPMNLAIHLTPPPELAERNPFATSTSLHRRWTMYPDSTRVYVDLIRAFARDTRFNEFLTANRPLVDTASVRLRRVVDSLDRAWIARFWGGEAAMDFVLAAGLTNGGASYGQEYTPASGRSEAYAIVGVLHTDAQGFPSYDKTDVSTVLHEMNHPYVTPLIRANTDLLRLAAESLYATVAKQMREQSYGSWDSMVNESLVRAAQPRYYLAHGDSASAERAIVAEIASGFLWTRELVALLGEYERNRADYPTFSAFMPRVIAFFRDWRRRP